MKRMLTQRELELMASTIANGLYTVARDPEARPNDRKYASVGFGVMVDKIQVLRGKPERPATLEADELRPGVRELARVILADEQAAAGNGAA